MVRGIVFFGLVWILVLVGIDVYRKSTGQDRLDFFKAAIYSTITAAVALAILSTIVILF